MNTGTQISTDELIRLRSKAHDLHIRPGQSASRTLAGAYRSSFRGRGMEFEEVRAYQAGDDIRHIDWRVTARTGKTHTKLFTEERERPVILVVDQGPSMKFATRTAFKSVIAAQTAALLGWGSLMHGDRVGMILFNENETRLVRPSSRQKQFLHGLHLLAEFNQFATHSNQPTQFFEMLRQLRFIARHGYLVHIISDFQLIDEDSIKLLADISRHNELALVNVSDPIESVLPGNTKLPVTDGQDIFTLESDTASSLYQSFYEERTRRLHHLEKKYGIHYFEISTTDNPADILRREIAFK